MKPDLQNKLPKHTVGLQIRFNDIDGLGHVNNSVYAQYFDMGRMCYFESLKGAEVHWQTAGLIIASTHTEFLSPIFLHDNIEVRTSVVKIGNKSLQMMQGLYDADTKSLKATCQSVMVGFDAKNNSSMAISDFWKDKIVGFEDEIDI